MKTEIPEGSIYLGEYTAPVKRFRPWFERYAIHPITGKMIVECVLMHLDDDIKAPVAPGGRAPDKNSLG